MSPAKSPPKPITPGSVKVLMLAEAGIIGFLSFWVLSEYSYNAYFRTYADQVFFSHVTTYSAFLGLGIGLAGSATAAILYRNLQHAKRRLETVVAPRIRGAVDKLLPSLPSTDTTLQSSVTTSAETSTAPVQTVTSPVTAIVPVPEKNERKKDSS